MGADAFVVYYGVRDTVPDDDDVLDELEEGHHPFLRVPRTSGLSSWWGRLTDGSDYHVILGKPVGIFGIQGESYKSLGQKELAELAADVEARLAENGIAGEAALHFQLEAQY